MAKVKRKPKSVSISIKRNPLIRETEGQWLSSKDRETIKKYNIFQVNRDTLVKIFDTYTLVASINENYIKAFYKNGPLSGTRLLEVADKDKNINRLGRILVTLKWE